MYRNAEGYNDPTLGAVMQKMMTEYNTEQRKEQKRQSDIRKRKRAYIVSKYAGDTVENIKNARRFCRFAVKQGYMPLASHLLYPQFLNDKNPYERELGTTFGLMLLASCKETWVFGTEHSPGMVTEIAEAKRLDKTIRYFDLNCKEITE